MPYPIIIPIKKPQYHHSYQHDFHHHGHPGNYRNYGNYGNYGNTGNYDLHHQISAYDHHTDFTNNKYQQVSAQRPQSSEQSSLSSTSSSEEFLPQPEHLREAPGNSQEEHNKLSSPSQFETPYIQQNQSPFNQQHQLHHQQKYAQLRKDLLARHKMRSGSEESGEESTEFRPIISSQSSEYMSPSNNVETVVPPPNQKTRLSFQINAPNEKEKEIQPVKEVISTSGQSNNQFTHNIEIPVQFYRLQLLENGEGFAISS